MKKRKMLSRTARIALDSLILLLLLWLVLLGADERLGMSAKAAVKRLNRERMRQDAAVVSVIKAENASPPLTFVLSVTEDGMVADALLAKPFSGLRRGQLLDSQECTGTDWGCAVSYRTTVLDREKHRYQYMDTECALLYIRDANPQAVRAELTLDTTIPYRYPAYPGGHHNQWISESRREADFGFVFRITDDKRTNDSADSLKGLPTGVICDGDYQGRKLTAEALITTYDENNRIVSTQKITIWP